MLGFLYAVKIVADASNNKPAWSPFWRDAEAGREPILRRMVVFGSLIALGMEALQHIVEQGVNFHFEERKRVEAHCRTTRTSTWTNLPRSIRFLSGATSC